MASGESDGLSVEGLQAELERLRGELHRKDEELAELKVTADTAMNGLAEVKVQSETTAMVLREELREAKEATEVSQEELREAREATEVSQEELEVERQNSSGRIADLESELAQLQRSSELEQLQTLQEHQSRLDVIMMERNRDVGRMEVWLEDLRKSHQLETAQLTERIYVLEKEHSTSTAPTRVSSPTLIISDPMTTFLEASKSCTKTPSSTLPVITEPSAACATTLSPSALPFVPPVSTSSNPLPFLPSVSTLSSTLPAITTGPLPARTTSALSFDTRPFLLPVSMPSSTLPAFTSAPSSAHSLLTGTTFRPPPGLPRFAFTSSPLTVSIPTTTSFVPIFSTAASTVPLFSSSSGVSVPTPPVATSDSVVQSMARLLQAQTEVMTAQAKAATLQTLPALSSFTGEGDDISDDGFDKWLEKFQERAKFAGWDGSDQLYHFKLLLDKTALDTFRMLPDSEKSGIEAATSALRRRFKPGGIEELRGLEFHHKTQGAETIEQLGLNIQRLGRKAFPSITGKEFDRLLKGRFYQALLVKWQRKLGPPKADESFHDLYTRARLLEEYEKQYVASAESRNIGSTKDHDNKKKSSYKSRNQEKDGDQQSSPSPSRGDANRKTPNLTTPLSKERRCYSCGQTGHLRNACPKRAEAPGRSQTSTTSNVTSAADPKDLSEEQLEQLLAAKKLQREQSLLKVSSNNVVSSACPCAMTVGSLLEVEVNIEGVPIGGHRWSHPTPIGIRLLVCLQECR